MPNIVTAQEILDAANLELGLPVVKFGTSSSDQTGRQAAALMNSVGDDLCRVHDWQFLESTADWTGDGVTSEFDLPADYGRMVNQTLWASSSSEPVAGPRSPQAWGWAKYGLVGSVGTATYQYRIINNKLNVFPTPVAGEIFTFFYIVKNWVKSGPPSNLPKSSLTLGTDLPLFDRRLMVSALKARLWGQKGFDTTQVQAEFNLVLQSEKSITQGAAVINLTRSEPYAYISTENIPDGGWG